MEGGVFRCATYIHAYKRYEIRFLEREGNRDMALGASAMHPSHGAWGKHGSYSSRTMEREHPPDMEGNHLKKDCLAGKINASHGR